MHAIARVARSLDWPTVALGAILIVLTATLSLYRLSESPPTWYDEGMLLQVSKNIAQHSVFGLQIAPSNFVSAGHVSTGFSVFAPIAASFYFFDVGILQGRVVAVLYIALLLVATFLLLKRLSGSRWALAGALSVATFSSLYGNGKNVLGEVPGLAFFTLFLLCFLRLEEESFASRRWALLSGLFIGLAVITKPIFILAGGAILIGLFASRGLRWITWRWMTFFGFAASIPLVLWVLSQFTQADSFAEIFSFYLNPYHISDIGNVMVQNAQRFFTESTPFFTLALVGVWVASVWERSRRHIRISAAEAIGLAFALLVIVFYLRTPGWYRYLFPADIVALIFFPLAILSLTEGLSRYTAALTRYRRYGAPVLVGVFLLFGLYHTIFSSWIAGTVAYTRSSTLTQSIGTLDPSKSVFVFNAPEVVPFLKTQNYYQYFTGVWSAGGANLALLEHGSFDYVIIHAEKITNAQPYLGNYKILDTMDNYAILGHTK